jgi:hypothetical protein
MKTCFEPCAAGLSMMNLNGKWAIFIGSRQITAFLKGNWLMFVLMNGRESKQRSKAVETEK